MPSRAEQKLLDAKVAAFHAFYSSGDNWGSERWEKSLYPALEQPTRHGALVNQYVSRGEVDKILMSGGTSLDNVQAVVLPQLPSDGQGKIGPISSPPRRLLLLGYEFPMLGAGQEGAGRKPEVHLFPAPKPLPLMSHWNLDAASALSAHMLDVQPGDRVLDLCAAPGGKSIALAQVMFDNNLKGCLHVNELDHQRNKRLQANLKAYLPQALFQPNNDEATIRTLQLDAAAPLTATRLPFGPAGYDRVLLDAPCSSERHIIHAHVKALAQGRIAQEMVRWSRNGTKNMAKTQTEMMMTALQALKMEGRLVYSTCSISSDENDGVIDRVLSAIEKGRKKGNINWKIVFELGREKCSKERTEPKDAVLEQLSEETKYGRIALPDHSSGARWGPLFFCVVTKLHAG